MEQFGDHALAVESNEDRELKLLEILQVTHHFVVVIVQFAEAEARIEDDIAYAQVVQHLNLGGEIEEHLPYNVGISCFLVHRMDVSLDMAEHIGYVKSTQCRE